MRSIPWDRSRAHRAVAGFVHLFQYGKFFITLYSYILYSVCKLTYEYKANTRAISIFVNFESFLTFDDNKLANRM